MEVFHLLPHDGNGLWSLDLFFNLLWKSTLLWLAIRGLVRYLNAKHAQRVWRAGLLGLLALFLLASTSLWELQTASAGTMEMVFMDEEKSEAWQPSIGYEDQESLLIGREQYALSENLDPILTWIWGLGFLFVLGKAVLEYLLLRYASRSAVRFDTSQADIRWSQLLAHANLTSTPKVLLSKHIPIPLTFGWQQPIILLPEAAQTWTHDRIRQILLHELIHIRQQDYLFNLVAVGVKGIYWFNPLSWSSLRQFRLNREWACDETLLHLGTDKYTYAENLIAIASLPHSIGSRYVATSFAKPSDLNARIKRLLHKDGQGKRSRYLSGWALLGLFLLSASAISFNLRTIAEKPYSKKAYEKLLHELSYSEEADKVVFLHQLGQWGRRDAFQYIKPYAGHENLQVRKSALWAVQQIGCLPAFGLLCQQLNAGEKAIQSYAAALLEAYPSAKLEAYLIDYLDEPSMHDWFIHQFEQIRSRGKTELLAKHLSREQPVLQAQIEEVLASPTRATLIHLQQLLRR